MEHEAKSHWWSDSLKDWPMSLPEYEDLDPKTSALVVVDLQRSCCSPEMGCTRAFVEAKPELARFFLERLRGLIIPNVANLLAFFRSHGLPVVYLRIGHQLPDGADLPRPGFAKHLKRSPEIDHTRFEFKMGGKALIGSPAYEILDEVRPEPGDLLINKYSASPFNSSNIDMILRNLGIDTLVMTGVSTNACVETTFRDASDRGYKILLVEDACGARDEWGHTVATLTCARFFGQVLYTHEVIAEFARLLQSRSS